ncbi:hypothetical protein M3Y94_00707000 [Aphelenchoides besseyi]|nr:hypothetical protein M3Y94_00707000 [Aphelenchoides besseyi]
MDADEISRERVDLSTLKMPMDTQCNCSICGIYCNNPKSVELHRKTHSKKNKWPCSICGTFLNNLCARNYHEHQTHNFERLEQDKKSGIVKIRKHQLSGMFNVGFNLVKTQRKATTSKAPRIELSDQDATLEELTELMERNPASPLIIKLTCKICGILCGTLYAMQQHMDSHERKNGFLCSLCGIQASTAFQRTRHEREVHNFHRGQLDYSRPEAVKVPQSLLSELKDVGLNVEAVQKSAFHGQVGTLCEARNRHPNEDSIDHNQTFSQPVLRKRLKPSQIDVITLEDSDDERPLPKQEIRRSAPVPLQTASQPSPQLVPPPVKVVRPIVDGIPKSEANRLFPELLKKPQIMYYDFNELELQFSSLPAHIYANSKNCEMLILRLEPDHCCAPLTLKESFGLLNITDHTGNFACFAKEYSQRTVSEFSAIFMNKPLTFVQMIQKLNDLNCSTGLIIANEQDRASISHCASNHLVIF